jgi:hypothetical protein
MSRLEHIASGMSSAVARAVLLMDRPSRSVLMQARRRRSWQHASLTPGREPAVYSTSEPTMAAPPTCSIKSVCCASGESWACRDRHGRHTPPRSDAGWGSRAWRRGQGACGCPWPTATQHAHYSTTRCSQHMGSAGYCNRHCLTENGSAHVQPLVVEPFSWVHWVTSTPLFVDQSEGATRCSAVSLYGRMMPESPFLPVLRNTDGHQGPGAVVCNTSGVAESHWHNHGRVGQGQS